MVEILLEIAGCPFGALADTSLWRSVSYMKRHLVIAPCVQTSWWGLVRLGGDSDAREPVAIVTWW